MSGDLADLWADPASDRDAFADAALVHEEARIALAAFDARVARERVSLAATLTKAANTLGLARMRLEGQFPFARVNLSMEGISMAESVHVLNAPTMRADLARSGDSKLDITMRTLVENGFSPALSANHARRLWPDGIPSSVNLAARGGSGARSPVVTPLPPPSPVAAARRAEREADLARREAARDRPAAVVFDLDAGPTADDVAAAHAILSRRSSVSIEAGRAAEFVILKSQETPLERETRRLRHAAAAAPARPSPALAIRPPSPVEMENYTKACARAEYEGKPRPVAPWRT